MEGANILDSFLILVICWFAGTKYEDITKDYGISPTTITDWFHKFMQVACYVLLSPEHPDCLPGDPHAKIGGTGTVVEADEAKFCKRKYNVGQMGAAQMRGWVLGAVERGSPYRMVFRPIFHGRRDSNTIADFILEYVEPGTSMNSDMHLAYLCLPRFGFPLKRINHKENYVDPNDPDNNTQSIEGEWKWARHELPLCGIKGNDVVYNLYFAKMIYRRLVKHHPTYVGKDPVKIFLKHLAAWYKAGQPDVAGDM